MLATITSKGQVTLPKPIRDRLHLRSGDKIEFTLEGDGGFRVMPVTEPVTRLKGMVPHRPSRPVSLQEMDDAVARSATRGE